MKKINKSVLVGLGDIGLNYDIESLEDTCYTHARALDIHPGYELFCGIDPDESKRALFESKFNKPAFNSLDECNELENSDLFVVSSPTHKHATNIREILENFNPDMILCEKPISENLEEAEQVLELSRKSRVKLFVNYFRRYDSSSPKIKEIIESSDDKNITVIVKYTKGFIHNGSHFFNLLEYFLDGYKDIYTPIDVNGLNKDSVNVCLEFNKGRAFFIHNTDSTEPFSMDITGTFGRITYMNGGLNIYYQDRILSKQFKNEYVHDISFKELQTNFKKYQWQVYDMIYNHKNSKEMTCTGEEALKTLHSMNKIMENIYGK